MQARIAPSLGELEGTHQEVWGTTEYVSQDEPTVFMGLYSLNDFNVLRNHRGKRYILWCGSDIRHLEMGYWIDDKGNYNLNPRTITPWMNETCENWVENEVEHDALLRLGIDAKVCPSFMGDVEEYRIEYKPSDRPQLYTSVSGNDFKLYGWDKIPFLAEDHPGIDFHLYGSTIDIPFPKQWPPRDYKNIIIHGRMPKEKMNEEIKHMTGALRLVEFDGFSEIIAKSMLWGQWPVSVIKYPHTFTEIPKVFPKIANMEGAVWCRTKLNQFPWNYENN